MKLMQICALSLGGALLFSACKKEPSQTITSPDSVSSFSEIKAPDGFDFNASKRIALNLAVENEGFQSAYAIEVYDSNPLAEGELIYKGFTNNDELSSSIEIPSSLKSLYVISKNPAGGSITEILPINGTSVSHTFSKKKNVRKTVVISPNCSAGCDQNISSGNWITLSGTDTYCITGNVSGITDNSGNAIVRICGNVSISGYLNLKENTELQVTDGSTLTVAGISMNSSNGSAGSIIVYQNATLNINSNFSPYGTVVNHGTMNMSQQIYFYGSFTNNGALNVLGTNESTSNTPGTLTNNGSIVVDGNFRQNSSNTIVNNCKLLVKKHFTMNSIIENNGYIQVDQNLNSNSGSELTYDDGAMLYILGHADGPLNGDMIGTGSTSLFKVVGGIGSNSGAVFSGNLEVCIGGTNSMHASTMGTGASLACDQAYIATTSCNPEGNGTPTVSDADNDNVPDSTDLFPNDPERAGEYYYPSANSFATIAFEDLWPGTGDYDFNDLVMEYRIRWITNANNDIKDMEFDYSVRAIGASQKNGFGLEISAAPSLVESVVRTTSLSNQISLNPNGTEAGQSNIVLIFFENAGDELANPGSIFTNTMLGEPYSTPSVSQVKLTFSTAQSDANIEFNPFMFINQNRGREVHMAGQAPTDLADLSYFGNSSDDSNPATNRYYVNKNNLPWAFAIPASFDYPAEKVDLVSAYNYFYQWALNSGQTNTDWYINNAGYRNSSLIY